ncbi:MAG: aminotransferase class I/II-fold pyridoxal phosphate-dependent enzyme, partial [Verrucomicrobiota bacterium]
DDWQYFEETTRKVKATRQRVIGRLAEWKFRVYPSQTNFIFAQPPAPLPARHWFEQLREKKILVRWWDADRIRDGVRVTIGTDAEMDRFLETTKEICEKANR